MTEADHFNARSKHARKRARERYGFAFDKLALASLRNRIADSLPGRGDDPGCVLVRRQDAIITFWALWHGGEWVPVVYDEEMRIIVTFLPPDWLRRHKRRLPW